MLIGCFIFFSIYVSVANGNGIHNVPHGVPPNRLPLYQPTSENQFQCLDGSKMIMYAQINDDYCDCPDGSDEPGTSACPNAIFYCLNKGHTSEFIPTSRVNDRICDCCDGSDEIGGSVECQNICEELGNGARLEKERLDTIARKGFVMRKELAKAGQKLKEEKMTDVIPLRTERDALVPRKTELESLKKTAEEKEKTLKDKHRDAWIATKTAAKRERATKLLFALDTNGDSKLSLDEVKQAVYLDSNKDGQVSDDEAKIYLTVDEADIDYIANSLLEVMEIAKKNYEEDTKKAEQSDSDDMIADEDKVDRIPEEEDDHDEDSMPPHDDETQKAIADADAARKEFDEVDLKIISLDGQIKEAEAFTDQDFGSDYAWASLKGQCYELDDKQYIYRICPFDKTIQRDKNSHSETTLGYWKTWSGAVPRKYSGQKYEDGQQCWNGPKRSTNVLIECGETHELVEVSEPAKCEYHFTFKTPAACNDPDLPEPIHTEL